MQLSEVCCFYTLGKVEDLYLVNKLKTSALNGEENREPKTHWNRFETPPNAVETQVIHRRWEGKSILLNLFPLF